MQMWSAILSSPWRDQATGFVLEPFLESFSNRSPVGISGSNAKLALCKGGTFLFGPSVFPRPARLSAQLVSIYVMFLHSFISAALLFHSTNIYWMTKVSKSGKNSCPCGTYIQEAEVRKGNT